jgi:adenylate cyclase
MLPAMPEQESRALVARQMDEEVAHSLGQGGLYSAGLGLFAGTLLGVLVLLRGETLYELPAVVAFGSGLASLLVAWVARSGRMRGLALYALMLPFVSLPTLLFLLAELRYPAGAATFLTGPFSVLYAFVIVITGFLLRFRVSAFAGFVVGLQYLGAFYLARPRLLRIDAGDELLYADLTLWSVALNRAMVYAAIGLATGGVAVVAKRLALRALAEQRQKDSISRLFGQYVSEEVKERILADPNAREGQRTEAVILFSDLRGFSTFSEGRAPEEIVARLNVYFEAMVREIRAHGGVVDKFIGDAVMAFFGGLSPIREPELGAVNAARGMRAALAELNARWSAEGLHPFDNGIGLHVGPVVLGPIGSEDRREFTLIGDAVNTASRLEGLTKELSAPILVTAALLARLPEAERRAFSPLGEVAVKGKQEKLSVFGLSP